MNTPKDIDDEIDARVQTWHEGLEARRRAEGLWSTDDAGRPLWLAPEHGPGAPVEPAGDDDEAPEAQD